MSVHRTAIHWLKIALSTRVTGLRRLDASENPRIHDKGQWPNNSMLPAVGELKLRTVAYSDVSSLGK